MAINDKYTHNFTSVAIKTTMKINIDLVMAGIFSQMCPTNKR